MSRCWKLGLKVFRSVEKKITDSPWMTTVGGEQMLEEVTPQTRGPDPTRKNRNFQVLSEKLDVAFRQLRVFWVGGGVFWKGIFFVWDFWGCGGLLGGGASLMMTDIPYNIAVWCVFFWKQPQIYIWHPKVCPRKKWSTFQIAGFTECCSHETKFGKKSTAIPPQIFHQKGRPAPFPKRLFFRVCFFRQKPKVLKSCTVWSTVFTVSVSRLGLKVRNPQISWPGWENNQTSTAPRSPQRALEVRESDSC